MKFIKLTAISAAVLASSAALAAQPVIVVDDAEVYEVEPVAVAYQAQPVAVLITLTLVLFVTLPVQ